MSAKHQPQRRIPSVDECLKSETSQTLIQEAGRTLVVEAYRISCDKLRTRLTTEPGSPKASEPENINQWLDRDAKLWLQQLLSTSLKPVLNLTGTVLHTNLGRAPMPEESIAAMSAVARGASNLEFNLNKGKRGDRDDHIEAWLCRLTGAEAATVVNNNAAAVLLCLNALASRKSVAVSRGELVEIGGSFRMPDIMKRAGCKLYEVGTTNRTHLADYVEAIADGATCLMRVHTSNFKVEGFSSAVDDKCLGQLAREHGIRFINDLGAGALIDMTRFGLPAEATPRQAIEEGAHVVTFSGDKLLGGPQCGLIVGDSESIKRIKKNPLKRALRCDKVTLAALESILKLYANPDNLRQQVPALRLLSRSETDIKDTSERLLPAVSRRLDGIARVSVRSCQSQIGSGALPIDLLPSWALVIEPLATPLAPNQKTSGSGKSAARKVSSRQLNTLTRALRQLDVPVIGRTHADALWLDLRCLEDETAFISNLDTLQLS